MKLLCDLKIGQRASINGINEKASLKLRRRLLELGFTHGQVVKLDKKSLLSHAFLVELRGYVLSIKREIASLIMVE